MKKQAFKTRYYQGFGLAFLLLFAGVSCLPTPAAPAAQPAVTVVQVNREVTRIVVQEVTRIVEVPVTVTPGLTPLATDTPLPTQTSIGLASPTSQFTPIPPAVSILIHTQCLFGPDPAYLGRYDLLANSPQSVIGRNLDGSWVEVQGPDHKYPCWVKSQIVKVNSGSLNAVLVVNPDVSPYSSLYPPPSAVSTNRVGNDVTIFWLPVAMSEADYHGYLVEAWVCQGGKQVFVAKAYFTSFDKNSNMLALKIADEPGCSQPSSARMYTVNNLGYSKPKTFPWAGWPTPTP